MRKSDNSDQMCSNKKSQNLLSPLTLKVLIVDDEADIRFVVSETLEDEGYKVCHASSAEAALDILRQEAIHILLLDVYLGKDRMNGVDFLKHLSTSGVRLPVIMMSGHSTVTQALEAMRYGAFDFIEKPFSSERLIASVQRALEFHALSYERSFTQRHTYDYAFVAQDASMRLIQRCLEGQKNEKSRWIWGAIGVGKEHFARALHRKHHNKKRFFMIDGAMMQAKDTGAFQNFMQYAFDVRSAAGTIFLKNADFFSHSAQKTLCALLRKAPSNVCFVASSREAPDIASNHGLLTQEFVDFFMPHVHHIPLAHQRLADLPLIAQAIAQIIGRSITSWSKDVWNAIYEGPLPENIRTLYRLCMFFGDQTPEKTQVIHYLRETDLPPHLDHYWLTKPFREARERFEYEYLHYHYERLGRVAALAQFIGMDRTSVYKKLQSLRLLDRDHKIDSTESNAEKSAL